MKNIRVVLSENLQFLEVKFSVHLNRRVFVMRGPLRGINNLNQINKPVINSSFRSLLVYC